MKRSCGNLERTFQCSVEQVWQAQTIGDQIGTRSRLQPSVKIIQFVFLSKAQQTGLRGCGKNTVMSRHPPFTFLVGLLCEYNSTQQQYPHRCHHSSTLHPQWRTDAHPFCFHHCHAFSQGTPHGLALSRSVLNPPALHPATVEVPKRTRANAIASPSMILVDTILDGGEVTKNTAVLPENLTDTFSSLGRGYQYWCCKEGFSFSTLLLSVSEVICIGVQVKSIIQLPA